MAKTKTNLIPKTKLDYSSKLKKLEDEKQQLILQRKEEIFTKKYDSLAQLLDHIIVKNQIFYTVNPLELIKDSCIYVTNILDYIHREYSKYIVQLYSMNYTDMVIMNKIISDCENGWGIIDLDLIKFIITFAIYKKYHYSSQTDKEEILQFIPNVQEFSYVIGEYYSSHNAVYVKYLRTYLIQEYDNYEINNIFPKNFNMIEENNIISSTIHFNFQKGVNPKQKILNLDYIFDNIRLDEQKPFIMLKKEKIPYIKIFKDFNNKEKLNKWSLKDAVTFKKPNRLNIKIYRKYNMYDNVNIFENGTIIIKQMWLSSEKFKFTPNYIKDAVKFVQEIIDLINNTFKYAYKSEIKLTFDINKIKFYGIRNIINTKLKYDSVRYKNLYSLYPILVKLFDIGFYKEKHNTVFNAIKLILKTMYVENEEDIK